MPLDDKRKFFKPKIRLLLDGKAHWKIQEKNKA